MLSGDLRQIAYIAHSHDVLTCSSDSKLESRLNDNFSMDILNLLHAQSELENGPILQARRVLQLKQDILRVGTYGNILVCIRSDRHSHRRSRGPPTNNLHSRMDACRNKLAFISCKV
jgi:hypothetical protein